MPRDVQAAYGRREVTKSLGERDRAKAAEKALPILVALQAEWFDLRQAEVPSSPRQRGGTLTDDEILAMAFQLYQETRELAAQRRMERYAQDPVGSLAGIDKRAADATSAAREFSNGDLSRWIGVTERTLQKAGLEIKRDDPDFKCAARTFAQATLDAYDVELRIDRGEIAPQPNSEVVKRAREQVEARAVAGPDVSFSELVDDYMRMWKANKSGNKVTNTEQQKRATYKLFGEFWGDKPIRGVLLKDAAAFRDQVKLLDPNWARSPTLRELHWAALLNACGDQEKGLSASTMNRHMRAMKSLWDWAEQRGHCSGRNPFSGFNTKIKLGENSLPYRAWEDDELRLLFDPPPKRADLTEVMIVAMFTGMRLDEIASLTWGRVRNERAAGGEIFYFHVDDAKTPAGIRDVPVHPALGWLLCRPRGGDLERLWPSFNPEGIGRKPGADAGREFSRFKAMRGFTSRQKTFHSFRKNVTRIMERAGVPENEWAQVFGHERGFTYARYNPDGITLAKKAEIIGIIDYPGIELPHPVS